MGFFISIISFSVMATLVILWFINKMKNKPEVNKLKVAVLCISVFIVGIIISSCSNNSPSNTDISSGQLSANKNSKVEDYSEDISLDKITGKNDYLKDSVILLEENAVNMGSYKVSIAGFKVESSTGDSIEDTFAGDGLIDETFDESTGRGFQIGFENTKAEVKNRDGYLSLYLKFGYYEDDIAQRDSIIPKIKIEVRDNKNDKGMLIYNSQKDKYIDLKSPYGVMLYKIYLDSEELEIIIGDAIFTLNMSEL